MNGAESCTAITGRPTRPWPKVHLVYFLLAGFDLMAILGGLFLSHQVIRVFDRNVRDFAALDRLMASSWILMDTAADAQAAAADALINRRCDPRDYELQRQVPRSPAGGGPVARPDQQRAPGACGQAREFFHGADRRGDSADGANRPRYRRKSRDARTVPVRSAMPPHYRRATSNCATRSAI